jgi:hypothetical protein
MLLGGAGGCWLQWLHQVGGTAAVAFSAPAVNAAAGATTAVPRPDAAALPTRQGPSHPSSHHTPLLLSRLALTHTYTPACLLF